MNTTLDDVLAELANCLDAGLYLATQDGSIGLARQNYQALLQTSQDHESAKIRFEAAQLISLLSHSDHRDVLGRMQQEDPDPGIRDLAKALHFRSLLAEMVLASGKLDHAGFEAYKREIREQAARHLFRNND